MKVRCLITVHFMGLPMNLPARTLLLTLALITPAFAEQYKPPNAEEMRPMPPEYLAQLAKIHEPPEMAKKPLQARKVVAPGMVELEKIMNAIGSPDKATHQQRETASRGLLEIAKSTDQEDGKVMIYSAVATLACLDGVAPQTIIGYASNAIGDGDDARALRARMYLKAGERNKALEDLEKLMASGDGIALVGGDSGPREASAPCGWSIADFDALGDDPRALAAKGLYLSSFIRFGAEGRGTVKVSAIRDLFTRAASSWRSPIPHFLKVTLYGFGSSHSMANAQCIRWDKSAAAPEIVNTCSTYDEGIRQKIRDLTMALVVDPKFVRALSERANEYLKLAQTYYEDGKPSRQLFELAINDYTAAIAAGGKKVNLLYCDRALALALIGKYKDAAFGYLEGMKYAKNGIEDDPFVYKQLAGVYMKLGKFNEAADLLTQAIINSSGGGMDVVIFGGGIKTFRTLYPEYGLLPDEILAETVRRRYYPQFPQSWNADFISNVGYSKGKLVSTILPELYAMRGDAYMKAGRRAEGLADYSRVQSDVWGSDPYSPRNTYFDKRGRRTFSMPEPWPPSPPTM